MKTKLLTILLVSALLASLIPLGVAYADGPVVSPGYDPAAATKAAVRYKNLNSGSGGEIYLGMPDLGAGGNRVENDFYRGATCDGSTPYGSWQASNHVKFWYVPADGKIYSRVSVSHDYCLEYNIGDLGDLNYLQIDVVNRASGTTVNLNNVTLDVSSLGDFVGVGSSTWNVTGVDLSGGFTLEGDLVLAGLQPGGETNKVQLTVGYVEPPNQPPIADANGPYMVAVGQSVELDGSGSSDPDGDPLSESWAVTGDALGTITDSTFTAGTVAGITEVTLTVDDGRGGTATDTAMVVVFDPDGGFVTGGGWIDSPAGAYIVPNPVWDQGFEVDADGWLDSDDDWHGTVTRVSSSTDGIPSASGGWHAIMAGDASSGPFSRFDGYRDTWPGSWTAEIDVYLDPGWVAGTGFDYTVAATGADGNHQRDYIFHVTKDTSTSKLLVAGSNNTNFAPREDLENINHYEVTTAGWYTLQHLFYEQAGALAVDLNLLDAAGNVLFTETRFNAADTIPGEVGGNRYAWFTFINVENGIAVDDHQLVIPTMPSGKATFGFVSKYKKGASVPEGNTEFQFKAGGLNFHSTSYDWLVVTGSNYAKFKGTGTINGAGEYKFQIWAGDGDPDTFRIKIWREEGESEHVIYDNGMDQAIGGGSIVVHTK